VSGSVPFDRAVEYYDRTRSLSDEAQRASTALLAAELRQRGRCLEVGVGTGLIALPLARAGVRMVGLDLSAPMLAKMVEKVGGRASFPLVVGDATSLPFGDGCFGGAILRHVLHLVPRWERAVSELARTISAGGVVIVSRGDVPVEWREATDRFVELVGRPSLAGLDPRDEARMDEVFARAGARPRDLPAIPERLPQSLGEFVDQMGEGMHSWTWNVEERTRREAAEDVRRWVSQRFGTLDPPSARHATLEWRAYDLA
jgi:SAM-dependent methyltransferase